MSHVVITGDKMEELVSRAADALNIVHWYILENNHNPIFAAAMLEGARRALLITSGCCTCETCMATHDQMAETIADHLEIVDGE